MSEFIRIIKRSRWQSKEAINGDINNIKAKTIVQEMSMREGAEGLSIWKLEDPADIALALISSNKENIEKIDVLKINEDELKKCGLQIVQIDGNSVVEKLNEFHYDIINMTYKNLGDFANVIVEALEEKENFKQISVIEIKKYINSAIENGDLELENLNEKLINKLKR